MRTKILVCCHKKDIVINQDPYMPIHVGKALNPNLSLGITEDNSGDNISCKNQSYCELTGLYWAWKNLKEIDVVGLCHYRRYFDFHNQVPFLSESKIVKPSMFDTIDLTIPESILEKVYQGSTVIATPIHYGYNLRADYCINHISDDFRSLETVIDETQSFEVRKAFKKYFYCNNKLSHYNMFLMNYNDFDKYCNWLFTILSEVEARTDITNYSSVQRRIYGYMAERLLNIWLISNNKDIIEKPIIKIADDVAPSYALWRRLSSKFRLLLYDVSLKFSQPQISNIVKK